MFKLHLTFVCIAFRQALSKLNPTPDPARAWSLLSGEFVSIGEKTHATVGMHMMFYETPVLEMLSISPEHWLCGEKMQANPMNVLFFPMAQCIAESIVKTLMVL